MLNFLLAMLQEFQKLIGKSKKPILTMFYAPWCGHCKRLKPEFAAAATETKTTTVLAGINADKPALSQLRMALNVTGYPTLFLFRYVQLLYAYHIKSLYPSDIKLRNDDNALPTFTITLVVVTCMICIMCTLPCPIVSILCISVHDVYNTAFFSECGNSLILCHSKPSMSYNKHIVCISNMDICLVYYLLSIISVAVN